LISVYHERLKAGASSLDVVCGAVQALEDSGLFLAGRGSAQNAEGIVELDASVMDGAVLRAGAIAAVANLRNPILGARAVMDHSPHVFLVGEGAARFLAKQRLEFIAEPSEYFRPPAGYAGAPRTLASHGTVGAVALDLRGTLAAATSTGGMVGKMAGRVSDSAIIGAATYADDLVAVSTTGHGEYFIRRAVAHDVVALVRYKRLSVDEAVELVMTEKLRADGAWGGMIALDKHGNISVRYNCTGLHAAFVAANGIPCLA
jgi:isoaspartyl peptidase/L-asparaginase-like protein (Ntn-hydrolase superfamily)